MTTVWTSNTLTFLVTIWEDINNDAEAIVISDTKYEPSSLSNIIYDVIDNKSKQKKLVKNSRVKNLYSQINDIRDHRDVILKDDTINMLVQSLFTKEKIEDLIPLDRVFLNTYYRRLLRARLERDYIGKELVLGLVITNYNNSETDLALSKSMIILRIICKFLGITSTTHAENFSSNKLYNPIFWESISRYLFQLFGETRIGIIELDDPLPNTSIEALIMHERQKEIRQDQVLMMLNIVFNSWSGSTLVMNGVNIDIIPATYISRMIYKLRPLC
jgi:hypothetical protein